MDINYIPFLFQGDTKEDLEKMFDGDIPVPGDVLEMVCYGKKTDTRTGQISIMCKWRVVNK